MQRYLNAPIAFSLMLDFDIACRYTLLGEAGEEWMLDYESKPFNGRNPTVCEAAQKDAIDSSCKINSGSELLENERYGLVCPAQEDATNLEVKFREDGLTAPY